MLSFFWEQNAYYIIAFLLTPAIAVGLKFLLPKFAGKEVSLMGEKRNVSSAWFTISGIIMMVCGSIDFLITWYYYLSKISFEYCFSTILIDMCFIAIGVLLILKKSNIILVSLWFFYALINLDSVYNILLLGYSYIPSNEFQIFFAFVHFICYLSIAAIFVLAIIGKLKKLMNFAFVVPAFLAFIKFIYLIVLANEMDYYLRTFYNITYWLFEFVKCAGMIFMTFALKNYANAPAIVKEYEASSQPMYAQPNYNAAPAYAPQPQAYEQPAQYTQPQTYAQPAYQQTYAPQPAYTQPVQSAPANQENIPAELRRYKQLFDEGVITEEEFTAKKKQILGL